MKNDKIVQIHGKDYMTVAGRLEEAQKDITKLYTEVLPTTDNHVVIRATVTVKGIEYTGISSVNLDASKMIEKSNPYEVAETSAVGRALGFAGYGIIEGIASADEMNKSATYNTQPTYNKVPPSIHTEDGNLPVRDINEDEPPFPEDGEIKPLRCDECGAVANLRSGVKNGKKWSGLFCTETKSHVKWLH